METLNQLFKTIKQRQKNRPEGSYTAGLFKAGLERICQKVGEEAIETVIAGMKKNKKEVVYEMADLFYHCLVLLAATGLAPKEIARELKKRFK